MCGRKPERPQASFQATPRSRCRDCATLGQVTERSKCGADAFVIEGGAISLCSEACARVNRDALATLDVVFSCTSTLLLR